MGLFDLFKKKNSGDVAKDRLKLLLVSDRANCSPSSGVHPCKSILIKTAVTLYGAKKPS